VKAPGWLPVYVRTPTVRLALSYLAIIMVMSLGFSAILYRTSAHALQRQLPPQSLYGHRGGGPEYMAPQINEYISERIDEGRRELQAKLVIVNLLVLVGGAWLSYFLARRTLAPIEANMEAQVQFVGDASHELRTPLTALQTSNEVALRNSKFTLADARQILCDNIEEVAKLQALTDGLLQLARPDGAASAMVPGQVDLPDLITTAINRVIPAAQAKHQTIDDLVQRLSFTGHRQTLEQAVVVLLDNAVKYSPAGSQIIIKAGRAPVKPKNPNAGNQLWIQVSDHGPGIRPYDLRKIFDRFYRADQSRSTQHVSGYGIGLALAKKIVEQHGGEISAESVVGRGSTFTIKLPL
jgi:two-component system sensor histidine kinase CiaH